MIALVCAVQARFDGLAAHAPGLAIDVDDHRRGAAIEHRVDGRGEGEVGHDHLVARPDAERDQRQMQRHGAVRDGDAVPDADEAAEVFLELVDVGALARDPSGDERVEHGAEVVTRHMGHCDLDGPRRAIDQDTRQVAARIDHRPQGFLSIDVVAQRVGRDHVARRVPAQRGIDDRRAVGQRPPYVVERDPTDEAMVVADDQA